jgi:hypothetical protein
MNMEDILSFYLFLTGIFAGFVLGIAIGMGRWKLKIL